MTTVVRTGIDRALDAAFPGTCVACGRDGPALCARCGDALDARLDLPPGVPIGLPADIPEPLLQLEWCAGFRGPVRDALHAIKYRGERRVAEYLGAAVARRWARAGVGGEVVVHVPVHATRRRDRGFDQAEDIARVAAHHLGLPHLAALERIHATVAQFDLDRADRARNVIGAFGVRANDGPRIQGRWIVLIDDVLTTGATLAACATALESAGAAAVSAITVARER